MKYYKSREQYEETIKHKAMRNLYLIKHCEQHFFDCDTDIKREVKHRERMVEETGVMINIPIRAYLTCRCKNCGGKMPLAYALGYMAALRSVKDGDAK